MLEHDMHCIWSNGFGIKKYLILSGTISFLNRLDFVGRDIKVLPPRSFPGCVGSALFCLLVLKCAVCKLKSVSGNSVKAWKH